MGKCVNNVIKNAKLVVRVISDKMNGTIKTASIFDNRTNEYWNDNRIESRGVTSFSDVSDMKATLNWCLNGDESKYRLVWGGQTGNHISEGYAYVFA